MKNQDLKVGDLVKLDIRGFESKSKGKIDQIKSLIKKNYTLKIEYISVSNNLCFYFVGDNELRYSYFHSTQLIKVNTDPDLICKKSK